MGAYHVPTDGLAKAVRVSEAQARRATEGGARFLGQHTVTGIRTDDGRVRAVVTDQGEIEADIVVCAAGIWGPLIGAMVGMTVPLQPMAHQYTTTGPLPEVAALAIPPDREDVHPIIRAQDRDLYFREYVDRLGVGSYAHVPMPIDAATILHPTEAPVMPSVLEFTPDSFAESWRWAQAIVPALRATRRRRRDRHQRDLLVHHGRRPAHGRVTGRQGLLARRSGVGHACLRGRQGDGRVAGRRRLADRPPRMRHEPVRTPPVGAVATSTTAASRTTSRSTTSSIPSSRWRTRDRCAPRRSTSASRSSARTSWRGTAGSGRTGTGRTRASWAAMTSRAATPGRSATGTRSPAPRRARRAIRPGCTT